jgi:hypothetical protein
MRILAVALCIFAMAGCPKHLPCEPLCGADTATFSKRCKEAFGATYSCPVAQDELPDADCKSLSGFSPGLKLMCEGKGVDVFCCDSTEKADAVAEVNH